MDFSQGSGGYDNNCNDYNTVGSSTAYYPSAEEAYRYAQIQGQCHSIAEATMERFKSLMSYLDGTGKLWTQEATDLVNQHYHDDFRIVSLTGRVMNRDQWLLTLKAFGARRGRVVVQSIWVQPPPPGSINRTMPCIDIEFLVRMPDAATGDRELLRSRLYLDETDGRVIRVDSMSTPGLSTLIDLQAQVMETLTIHDNVDPTSVQ